MLKKVWADRMAIFLTLFLVLVCTSSWAQEPQSSALWILNREHVNVLVAVTLFSLLFFCFVWWSRRGRPLTLRKIAGIQAIEDAIGRATEMGRPVLFVPGIENIQNIQTLAGIAVLSHVARMVAEYDAQLIVPTRDSIVMSVCEEAIKEAYLAAGRPDAYKADNIRYLSDEQFAFTAGVDGIMVREKPAANLYLGAFYAESLILAEIGQASGAIQVAGTAQIPQLPFFIVGCDFTIMAEEFFAASAYLSRDLKVLSSIKAADLFKIIVIVWLLAGVVAATLAPAILKQLQFWF